MVAMRGAKVVEILHGARLARLSLADAFLTCPAVHLKFPFILRGADRSRSPGRRLRVLRGSAEDPLNLLQVMLAKGATGALAPILQMLSLDRVITNVLTL